MCRKAILNRQKEPKDDFKAKVRAMLREYFDELAEIAEERGWFGKK